MMPTFSTILQPTFILRPTVCLALASLASACVGAGPKAKSQENASSQQSSTKSPATSSSEQELPQALNAGKTPQEPLLDNLEDGNHRIETAEGRGGYWYTYVDESSTIEPQGTFALAEGGPGDSQYAARMQGQIGDAQYPYAGMGFSLAEPKEPYDLSGCEGIAFMAKKGSEESTGNVRFKVGDVNTVPEGGVCKDCYNDFGRDLVLTTEWTQYETSFSEMEQEPYWGEPQPKIDASRAYQLQWQTKDPSAPFDIWVDNVRLIGCGGSTDGASAEEENEADGNSPEENEAGGTSAEEEAPAEAEGASSPETAEESTHK